ncbi:MAG: prepilin-type N-terminal cleavage/methylation domain-containing protein, partial [Nitrospirae bacterium]|nr:prepilin-type N-terminal cleavage/methylation domain-containing protein [Nitrospirota bacterium]
MVKTGTSTAGNKRGFTLLEEVCGRRAGGPNIITDGSIRFRSVQAVRSQTGFTLFELLIVLFIIGLSAA